MNKRIRKKHRRQMLLHIMENMRSNQVLLRSAEGWYFFPLVSICIKPFAIDESPEFTLVGRDHEFFWDVRKEWWHEI